MRRTFREQCTPFSFCLRAKLHRRWHLLLSWTTELHSMQSRESGRTIAGAMSNVPRRCAGASRDGYDIGGSIRVYGDATCCAQMWFATAEGRDGGCGAHGLQNVQMHSPHARLSASSALGRQRDLDESAWWTGSKNGDERRPFIVRLRGDNGGGRGKCNDRAIVVAEGERIGARSQARLWTRLPSPRRMHREHRLSHLVHVQACWKVCRPYSWHDDCKARLLRAGCRRRVSRNGRLSSPRRRSRCAEQGDVVSERQPSTLKGGTIYGGPECFNRPASQCRAAISSDRRRRGRRCQHERRSRGGRRWRAWRVKPIVAAWDSTLGYPGEGGRINKKRMFSRRPTAPLKEDLEPHRRKRGDGRLPRSQHRLPAGPGRQPPPPKAARERPPVEDVGDLPPPLPRGLAAPPPPAKKRRRGRRELTAVDDIRTRDDKLALIDALKQARHSLKHFKKKAGAADEEEAPPETKKRERHTVRTDVSAEYARRRMLKFAERIQNVCVPLPDVEVAHAIDHVIRALPVPVREELSLLPAAKQEQFMGAKQALNALRTLAFSVDASLDCRLEVPLSFKKLSLCNTFLSQKRSANRTMERIELMPLPSPIHESRARGLGKTSLFAPLPFRTPQSIRERMRELLIDDDVHVSDDGRALQLNVFQLARECFTVAREEGTLRMPAPPRLLRLQYMFDGYRYMRGRGATRWGLRPMDIKYDLSSLMYWRDVAFYSGQDKYDKLQVYCKSAISQLNSGVHVELLSRDSEIVGAHTYITLQVGDDSVWVHGGGDAAAASAEGGREGPAGKYGCCAYCVLRKVADGRAASPWFDEKACAEAERRTCWSEHCRAHERPPGCPADHNPRCPDCSFVCTEQAVQTSRRAKAAMSASARSKHDSGRRRTHAGAEEHKPPLVWLDHKYRVPSALHLLLNGVGTNIAVSFAAGATPAVLKAINAELSKPEHNLFWRVRESKKGRDVRPNGPECRKLLFTPGLIQKLIAIRFDKAVTSDERLPSLQARGAALLHAVSSREGVLPAAVPKRPSKPAVVPTQSRQLDGSAILKALGGMSARPIPSAAAASSSAPPEQPVEQPANDDHDSEHDDDDDEGVFEIPAESEEDVAGALLVWSSFMELVLELHEPWDDHDQDERVRRGEAAEVLGKKWVAAVRRHSKYTCAHYYCHIAFAHLRELIVCNGHLFSGDDAILERGHQQYKRLRGIISSGGKACVDGARPKMTMIRQKVIKGRGLEMRVVQAPCRATAEEQLGMLVRVLTKRRAARPAPPPSAKVVATQLRMQGVRASVKRESLLSIDLSH